jgi:hypothetical protein
MSQPSKQVSGVTLTPVFSKTVSSMGYSPERKVMIIEFNNNSLYEYYDVTQELFDSVKQDESIGSRIKKDPQLKNYKKI